MINQSMLYQLRFLTCPANPSPRIISQAVCESLQNNGLKVNLWDFDGGHTALFSAVKLVIFSKLDQVLKN